DSDSSSVVGAVRGGLGARRRRVPVWAVSIWTRRVVGLSRRGARAYVYI
ncbi:hypothetical protein A2U01_0101114, partial [Trifolium medium]|nr:hypothetical protein [Trifolium medium]